MVAHILFSKEGTRTTREELAKCEKVMLDYMNSKPDFADDIENLHSIWAFC